MTNTTTITVPAALAALVRFLAEDAPTSKAEAKKRAKQVSPALTELTEWAEELRDVLDEATNAVEQMAEAGSDEREDEHSTANETIDSALMILERCDWERPEATA